VLKPEFTPVSRGLTINK